MEDIPLAQYGALAFVTDPWDRQYWTAGVPTAIGPVEVDVWPADPSGEPVDPESVDLDGVSSRVVAVLQRITDIDREARAYLAVHAPEDVQYAGELIRPSLLVHTDEPRGSFTIFYHGIDEADEMVYGVEFRDFHALSLAIGD